jgi:glucosamine--fructose-6-phosphate aminotransferase (isomerizing)
MPEFLLQKEIEEQPEIIRNLLEKEISTASDIAHKLTGKFDYILIAARGTSDNAARYAQYLFGAHNRIQVSLATPSLYSLYSSAPSLKGALVIGISQSGMSPDIISVLAEAKKQNRPTLAITNNPTSPLAFTSDYVLPINAGQEIAIAATKTYTATLAALALLSCSMENDKQRIRLAELNKIPNLIYQVLKSSKSILPLVKRYRYMDRCTVISRGFNYSTCFEISLKIKELTKVVAEPYSSADFRHGPIATISKGFPVFIINPTGKVSNDLSDLIYHLNRLEAEIITISDKILLRSISNIFFKLPSAVPEWLTPLLSVIPGQLFAMQLAIEKGFNPDSPQGLAKITETL